MTAAKKRRGIKHRLRQVEKKEASAEENMAHLEGDAHDIEQKDAKKEEHDEDDDMKKAGKAEKDEEVRPQDRMARGGAMWITMAFVLGVFFVTVSLTLLWSIGAVQIQIRPSSVKTCDDVKSHAFETFKQEAENRLALQDRMLKDILSRVETNQRKEDAAQQGLIQRDIKWHSVNSRHIEEEVGVATRHSSSPISSTDILDKVSFLAAEVGVGLRVSSSPNCSTAKPYIGQELGLGLHGLSSPNGSTATPGHVGPFASKPGLLASVNPFENIQHLLHGAERMNIASNSLPNNRWMGMKSACAIWIVLVVVCSLFQTPLMCIIKEQVHKMLLIELDKQTQRE